MIFRVKADAIEPVKSFWDPRELELEKYLLPDEGADEQILNHTVFGEDLLFIGNQVRTKNKKRADILALDRFGNAVIIELKKDAGKLGVEMQALQYLADFSRYKGKDFIAHFSKSYTRSDSLKDDIEGFMDNMRLEDINKCSRIILMARYFDSSLYSMGKWLASCDVAFRCVRYTPYEIGGEHYLSFSIVFDQSPAAIYPLSFQPIREPQYFWHNIGRKGPQAQDWWDYLVKAQQISTSFENEPGDEGERILKKYIRGDTVIAYASGHGAVGVGVIKAPTSYHLLSPSDKGNTLSGHLHRMAVKWEFIAKKLSDGLAPDDIKALGGYPPIRTSVRIDDSVAERLIAALKNRRFE